MEKISIPSHILAEMVKILTPDQMRRLERTSKGFRQAVVEQVRILVAPTIKLEKRLFQAANEEELNNNLLFLESICKTTKARSRGTY